jgi:DNA-binding transcriptional regulator GbsR (MarR family)
MQQEKLTYIEESGLLFEQLGMTRMAGRVFGYLIISDKDAVSFDDIREILKASKGSISGTTKMLLNAGLIESVSLPGDRKTYYRPSRMKVGSILKARIQLFKNFSEMIQKGRELKEREDDISDWLFEVSTFYSWVGNQINEVVDRWEEDKEEIMKQHGEHHEESNT